MAITGKAFFIRLPERIEYMDVPHSPEAEQPFEVVRQVKLTKIAYENFITDMMVWRQFIEDNAEPCATGQVWRCMLVQRRGHPEEGILVMPRRDGRVEFAALYKEEQPE